MSGNVQVAVGKAERQTSKQRVAGSNPAGIANIPCILGAVAGDAEVAGKHIASTRLPIAAFEVVAELGVIFLPVGSVEANRR